MQINEKYRLGKYNLGYQLEEKKVKTEGKNAGEEYWKPIAYYNFDLRIACRSILKRLIHDTNTETLEGITQAVNNAEQTIVDAIEKLKE